MDKKTIWIVVVSLLLLLAGQTLTDRLFPPVPKTAGAPPAETAATGAPPAHAEAPPPVPVLIPALPPVAPESALPAPTIELSNDLVRVVVTGRGGGIQIIELLRHREDGSGHVQLNRESPVPALSLLGVDGADAGALFAMERTDARTVVLRATAADGALVTKKLSLGDGYLMQGSVEISPAPTPSVLSLVVGTIIPNHLEPSTFLGLDLWAGGKYQQRTIWDTEGTLIFKKQKLEKKQNQERLETRWLAVKNQFFTMVLTPSTNAVALGFTREAAKAPPEWTAKVPPQGLTGFLTLQPGAGSTNGAARFEFQYYAGPKEYDRLAALGEGQDEIMQFGFWGAISVVLLKSMKFFYRLIPSYGLAIILITIVIKMLFWPIQAKSIKSMKEMQKYQPLMAKLREKYKDDPQRLNQETMKLFKEHKINPMAGCLPMLVQIPVFFALFAMLRSSVELRGAGFLWINDLSQPDTIFHLPFFGLPVNPLPLLMGVSMLWQMKLTPSTGDPKQQQMMTYMPLIMLVFFYSASSGLTLYWTVQQLLSIAQQWWSLRQPDAAALPKSPALPGKTK